jgi:hypothetical protein
MIRTSLEAWGLESELLELVLFLVVVLLEVHPETATIQQRIAIITPIWTFLSIFTIITLYKNTSIEIIITQYHLYLSENKNKPVLNWINIKK